MAKALLSYGSSDAILNNTFITPFGFGAGAAAEVDAEFAITNACTISNARYWISSGGSGTNDLRLRKNGADANILMTRTGSGVATDLVNTDSFLAGDVCAYHNTSSGTDPIYRSLFANVEFNVGHGCYHSCSRVDGVCIFDITSATRFIPIHGELGVDGNATEANVQWKNRGYTSISSFQVRVQANARLNDTTFNLRLNGSDVAAATITVEPAQTGLFTVTGLATALADGDLLCASITTGAGTEDLVLSFVGVALMSTSSASECWTARMVGHARTASATEHFYAIGGSMNAGALTSITNQQVPLGFPADLRNLRTYISANTCTGDVTLSLYVNSVAVMTQAITAATTGWFENTVDEVRVDSDDIVCLSLVGGTANSLTVQSMGFTAFNPTPVNPSVTSKGRLGGGLGFGGRSRVHSAPVFSIIEHD
jgi:hypothetical protein